MQPIPAIRHPLVVTIVVACILLVIAAFFGVDGINMLFRIIFLVVSIVLLPVFIVLIIFEVRVHPWRQLLWKPSNLPLLLAITAALTVLLLRILTLLGR